MVKTAAVGTSFFKVKRNLGGFTTVLQSAACEWFLSLLLLIDAVFSYLLTKFAHHCQLQTPCILCSRLDHVLGNENPGFYQNLLCSNHRSEISSLISCHIHGKLADGCSMCEECLLSFTPNTKSTSDIHRLLMRKLGLQLGPRSFQNSLLNRKSVPGSAGMRLCSCCHKPWRSRFNAHKLLQLKPRRTGMTKPKFPWRHNLTHTESTKKMKQRYSGSVGSRHPGKSGYDPLSHVGYAKIDITSESESDFPFSDDDEASSVVYEMKEPNDESIVKCFSHIPSITANFMAPEKVTEESFKPCLQPHLGEVHNMKCLISDADAGHDLVKVNWQEGDQKTTLSTIPELISLDDFPPLPNKIHPSVGASTEKREHKFPFSHNSTPSFSELLSLIVAPSLVNTVDLPDEASQRKYGPATGDNRSISMSKSEEILKSLTAASGASCSTSWVADELPSLHPTDVDTNDMLKPAVTSKEPEASVLLAEKDTIKGPGRVDEDLKIFPAEKSVRGIDFSSNNSDSGLQCHGDEYHIIDASGCNDFHTHHNSVFIEKTKSSGHDSFDRGFVSETEGESLVDWLKQQVEYDRTCINDLYRELEEERSAAAIAANQAMAMITRLQEEKATLHMEALQYLRMMEEQAEYDVEALEKANDLLAEKEKELQDLEAELEFFTLNVSVMGTMPERSCDLKRENISIENNSIYHTEDDVHVPPSSMFAVTSNGSEKQIVVKSSWTALEDEKFFILQCLKSLEKKLHQFALGDTSTYLSDGDLPERTTDRECNNVESLDKEGNQINGVVEGNNLVIQNHLPLPSGSLPTQKNASVRNDQTVGNVNNNWVCNGQKSVKQYKEINLVTLENEISDLNERLEALETDWNFLEHTMNCLKYGKEGLQFVQEIAHQLHELQEVGIRNRRHSVP